ncbi:DUF192 domain-containing protein [Microlunatus aurantiacus]|uniref:DUF192 domain-containing protein n=1 Tax=Microlunatus aurantiacus TaxID=446786 RepID=UPI0031DB4C1A
MAALLAVLIAVVGCSPPSPEPTYATVTIGPLTYRVEVAQTVEQQREGLGNRESVPAGTGMLFQFGSRGEQQVWMAGMTIKLDIAWIIDSEVLAVDTVTPCLELDQNACPRWTSPAPVDALLEVPAHSLTGVDPGVRVSIEH